MCTNDYGESVSRHLAGVANAYGSLDSNGDGGGGGGSGVDECGLCDISMKFTAAEQQQPNGDRCVQKYLKYIDGFKRLYPDDDSWIDLKYTHFDDLESIGIPTFSKH